MATKTKDGEYSLKLAGAGVSIDKTVSGQVAVQILRLVMGDTSGSGSGSAGGCGWNWNSEWHGSGRRTSDGHVHAKGFHGGKAP
jgi:hypothetical protein